MAPNRTQEHNEESSMDCRDPAQEASERSWDFKAHRPDIELDCLLPSPMHLPDSKMKISGLTSLMKEISRQSYIDFVMRLLILIPM